MLLSALFVGLVFGFTAYHYFVAPYVLKRGLEFGMRKSTLELQYWLSRLPQGLREQVEANMKAHILELQADAVQKARDVAAKAEKL